MVFADIRSAGEAIRTMQGFPFFDKPMVRDVIVIASKCTVHANRQRIACGSMLLKSTMLWYVVVALTEVLSAELRWCLLQRITYAKTKSDALAKAEGTYVEKDKAARQKHNAEQRGGTAVGQPIVADTLTLHNPMAAT